ncbi:MAG TPA: hypothetical protein VNM40_02935 [Candidatus Paceibacterota bacterium]|nr:hypothetical protein [Candidatus Paceibacterota bacterium]
MKVKSLLRLVFLAATLATAFWLGSIANENAAVQNLITSGGYLGVFLFSIINGFNIVVPIVTASFVPALVAAGLNPYFAIAVISLGMTIADCAAYFLARLGRVHLTETQTVVARILRRAEKRQHWLPLVLLALFAAFVPIPTEVVLIPLGLLGYRSHSVVPIVFVGNALFNSIVGLGSISLLGG